MSEQQKQEKKQVERPEPSEAELKKKSQADTKYRMSVQSQFEIVTRDWMAKNCAHINRGFHELYPYQELCHQIYATFKVDLLGKGGQDPEAKKKFEKATKTQFKSFVETFTRNGVKHPEKAKSLFPYQEYTDMIFEKFDVDVRTE